MYTDLTRFAAKAIGRWKNSDRVTFTRLYHRGCRRSSDQRGIHTNNKYLTIIRSVTRIYYYYNIIERN